MTMKNMRKYSLNQCALYKCRSKRRLAEILRISIDDLHHIRNLIQYYTFSRDKKDGDQRIITAPRDNLKKIQKRILRLFVCVERPDWLMSGERGKSYIDNAKAHQQSKYFLTVDIRKFYENCDREYVYCFFKKVMHMSSDVAALLTDIVTLERKIPTGCPTSQIIAYYSYQEMFSEIHKMSLNQGCIFTLYVDDMTFSSEKPFNPSKLKNKVDILLRKYGHRPNYSKVKYYSRNTYKLITGVAISKDNRLLVANNLRKKIYDGAISQIELQKKNQPLSEKEIQRLKGRLQAARNVEKRVFPEIHRFVQMN